MHATMPRNLFKAVILFIVSMSAAFSADKVVVTVTERIGEATVYGEPWQEGESVDIAAAISDMTADKAVAGKFSGRITSVCQKKGCWMILETDGKFARVDFNSHAFFIPKDSTGPAEVIGTLKLKQMSDAMRAHLADDGAGDLPVEVWEIVATSVKLG